MRTILFAMLVPLAACGNVVGNDDGPGVLPSGSGTARSFAVTDFTAVELRGPDDVDVRVGAGFSVRAEGDADALDSLRIERVGETLRIGRIRKAGFSWSSGKSVKLHVTMPRITAADLVGSGDLVVDRAEGARFAAGIAGSGDLSIGSLATQTASLSIAGSGSLNAAGTTDTLKIDVAGSGDVAAGGLTATGATISIAGSGNVKARVNGNATVTIMGSGDVDLGGGARCQSTKMGSGSIRCG